jgi:hypothetical protein
MQRPEAVKLDANGEFEFDVFLQQAGGSSRMSQKVNYRVAPIKQFVITGAIVRQKFNQRVQR